MKQNSLCSLCKIHIADKTNSHIIPNFLTKFAMSPTMERKRDGEVMVSISPLLDIETYIGRDVKPELIETIKGRAMTEDEICNNFNPMSRDNIFCSDCEKKFSVIESIYSNSKIEEREGYLQNNIAPHLAYLFWMSVIWRMSITNIGLDLTHSSKEKLRCILNNNLSLDKNNITIPTKFINRFHYFLLYTEEYAESAIRNILSTNGGHACQIANRIIIFYDNNNFPRFDFDFYGTYIKTKNLNGEISYEKLQYIPIQNYMNMQNEFMYEFAKASFYNLREAVERILRNINVTPSSELVSNIVDQYLGENPSEQDIINEFNPEKLQEIIIKCLYLPKLKESFSSLTIQDRTRQ